MIMIETPERSVTAQDVTRAVRNCTECVYKRPDGCSAWECNFISRPEAVEAYRRTRWIPVEERLPETDEFVLVSCRTKKGIGSVNRAYYSGGFWHGSGSMAGVVAWMPLPEPYKEGAK